MNKKKAKAILIFLLCVSIPILILALFTSTMGEDLYAMFFYYPLIFLVGGLSAWAYYKFGERVKIHKAVWLILILLMDFVILISFYPKGGNSPINQLRVARQVVHDYENLEPVDLFEAIDKRHYLRITALYHKFSLPKEIYVVKYCFNDNILNCETLYRKFDFLIMDNKVVSNNPDFDCQLDLKEGSFTFSDTVETIDFQMTINYPHFGVTARWKDIGNLRVIVFETKPKFDYGFTKLFEKCLNITQGTKEKNPTV
jgi:hypothetical protein